MQKKIERVVAPDRCISARRWTQTIIAFDTQDHRCPKASATIKLAFLSFYFFSQFLSEKIGLFQRDQKCSLINN